MLPFSLLATESRLLAAAGIEIVEVNPGSAGERAGLLPGDVVIGWRLGNGSADEWGPSGRSAHVRLAVRDRRAGAGGTSPTQVDRDGAAIRLELGRSGQGADALVAPGPLDPLHSAWLLIEEARSLAVAKAYDDALASCDKAVEQTLLAGSAPPQLSSGKRRPESGNG
jgi:hypothetical protein